MVEPSAQRATLWTGRWMAGADGEPIPVVIEVPLGRHVNNGRGVTHYLAKGFKRVEQIPADGAADALRLSRGRLPDVEAYLAAMDAPAPADEPPDERKEPTCSPPKE